MRTNKNIRVLLPFFGTIIFVVLYIVASFFYPGGSQTDLHSTSFNWRNNYWCNLLNDRAINGQRNSAQPIALAGMLVLCVTLIIFWWIFARFTSAARFIKVTIRVAGTAAMIVAFFLFTHIDHDLVTNVASLFCAVAIAGTLVGLYKDRWHGLFYFGLFNLLLTCLNNYVYYHPSLIMYLPVIQKISFASFLLWICCIDLQLFRLRQ